MIIRGLQADEIRIEMRRRRVRAGLTGATSSDEGFADGRCVEPGEANGCDWASANGDRGSDHNDDPDLLLRCLWPLGGGPSFRAFASNGALPGLPGEPPSCIHIFILQVGESD